MTVGIVYPSTRERTVDATVPVASISPTGATPLSIRTWPWRAGANVVNARTTVVSPSFQGPAIIRDILFVDSTANTPGVGWALYWSTDSGGAGQNLAGNIRPTGTPILEPISFLTPALTDPDEIREHWDGTQAGITVVTVERLELRKYISQQGSFFLKLTVRNGGAGTIDLKGSVTVVENVPPELAATFT